MWMFFCKSLYGGNKDKEEEAKYLEKSEGKLGTLYAIWFYKFTNLVPFYFLLKYIMWSPLTRLPPLHWENGQLSKMGLFSIFLYTFTINCVTTGARKKPIEYMNCFIYSQQCITIISSRKMSGFKFFSSVFKKIIPYNTIPTFSRSGWGNSTPHIFKLLSLYIFKMCAMWHEIFRRKSRRIVLLSKRLWYCCSGIYLLETSNLVINCIIIVPDCGLPNVTKSSNFMNYS